MYKGLPLRWLTLLDDAINQLILLPSGIVVAGYFVQIHEMIHQTIIQAINRTRRDMISCPK
jgi:hypothetical protein